MVGKPDEKPRSAWAEALRISDLGLRLVFSVGLLVALGLWLDRRLALMRFPLFAVVGAILGFGVGMVALVRGLTASPKRADSATVGSAAEHAKRDADEPGTGSGTRDG